MVETAGHHGHAAKPVAAKPVASSATPAAASKPAAAPAPPKPAEHKATGAQPNRALFKRSTYAGVTDTGPVPGESFEQKVARLKAVSVAAKQRAEEGGEPTAPAAAPVLSAADSVNAPAATPASAETPAPLSTSAAHKPTGKADRTLMKRSTYCEVVDTGPISCD